MKRFLSVIPAVLLMAANVFADVTVNAVMQPLRILDPVITTTFITRYHGFMIYDTLIAQDSHLKPKPQMADWTISDDQKVYTFKLRDGLMFHDHVPVTATDVIASIKRWAQKDTGGQIIIARTEALDAPDDKTVVWKLVQPFPVMLDILAKQSSLPLFIMPARVAATPSDKAITDYTGSGPFKFVQSEFQPGISATYAKFDSYVPRKEPADGMAGGKVVNVDRVKWLNMSDAQTAVGAISSNEIDYLEQIPIDLLPLVASDPAVKVETRSMTEMQTMARMNFLHPPFNNPKIREAALKAISQVPVLAATVGDEKYYKVCGAVLGCGVQAPYGSEKNSSTLIAGNGMEQAKALLREAGYDGSPVVLLAPTDYPSLSTQPVTIAQMLRTAGFKVDLQSMDWQTLVSRRAGQKAPKEGGWNMFVTSWLVIDIANPLTNAMLNGNGSQAWFGWPDDKGIESLKNQFIDAKGYEEQRVVAEKMQTHAIQQVLEVPLGQFSLPQARRVTITDMINAPTPVFWNLHKIH
jgi:peptide/nickel transport system substrate-binding protein